MSPQVSLTTEPELLIESEETVSLYNFSLSEPPPENGIIVNINPPDLSDFDLSQAQIEGGRITLNEEFEQELQDALDGTRAAEVPGAVVAIVSPFASWFGASGVANLENNTPLQPSDRFQIGSITKTFVATTALKLVEEGVLSLEDTLTTWLPESLTVDIPNAQEITLENLLQHTSGVADYLDVLFNQAATNPAVFLRDWQPEELVDLIDGAQPSFEPGESWEYSNTNFILAGLVIEAATGNNIGAEIRSRVIEPLNLENTFFAGEEEVPGGIVSGYWDFDGNGTLDNITPAGLSWAWSAGAMISNAEDLDTFARNLFAGDLLEPESLERMLNIIPAPDNNNYSSYGLGVGTIESPNRFWYIHRGQTLGYRSNMWYSPAEDLTYIELINGFSDDNLVRDVLPPFRRGIFDGKFSFTITEQDAQIVLPVLNDGVVEGEETVTFTIEPGEGYEVNPDASSGTFTIVDTVDGPPPPLPNVALGAFPDEVLEGDTLIIFFEVSNITQDGLYVYVDSETPQSLSQFALDRAIVTGGESLVLNPDLSGFAVKIFTDNAFLEIPVAVDNIQEEPVDITYEIKTRDEISNTDLAAIETVEAISDYTINPLMVGETITISDVEETEPNVALGAFPSEVLEGDTLTLFFEVTDIPQDGLYVYVDSETPQSLSQFALDQAVVNGGESLVVNPDLSGFAVKIFDIGAQIEIPVAVDDIAEEPIDITYELKTRDEISTTDLAAIETVETISDYTINPLMVGETITILDNTVIEPEPLQPEPVFGSIDGDTIEVSGSNQLIFGGAQGDLIDASIGSKGGNRIYASSGDDTLILGMSDRIVGGDGDDEFYTTSGGGNIITGGAGADQFWIAVAETPDAANTITDFTNGEDVLGIAGLDIGFDDLSITQQGDNTLIAAGGPDLAILQGIDATSLMADNFAFA